MIVRINPFQMVLIIALILLGFHTLSPPSLIRIKFVGTQLSTFNILEPLWGITLQMNSSKISGDSNFISNISVTGSTILGTALFFLFSLYSEEGRENNLNIK